ncbi:MAG: hypothetical protein E6I96_17050 [Chloroflexi bacterium]|nr:MAG: hypothetical protein E6I96_17050 [Chloroflexota bacterium]
MEKLTDKLFTVKYNEDTGKPHIEIVDQNVCFKKNLVSFGNCIECGACSIGCPFDNIACRSPRGGYGVRYQHG